MAGMAARRWGRFVWIGTAQAKALDAGADELDTIVSLGMMGLHKVIAHEEGPQNVTANAVLRGGDATDEDVWEAATAARRFISATAPWERHRGCKAGRREPSRS